MVWSPKSRACVPETDASVPAEPRPVQLPFRIGARTVCSVRRRLVRIALPLRPDAVPEPLALPPLPGSADGFSIGGLPVELLPGLATAQAGLRLFVRQHYHRSYVSLGLGFETYLATFSSKARSTLKRKQRKLAERSGGSLDVRSYSAPQQVDEFHRHARSVSATTYQERLLNAGLPDGEGAREWMRGLAARGAMRGWLLFLDDRPISYLFAPADGDTLLYAYLGYDPAHADFSPGTVLQLEAIRELMSERRFRLFDFTEGDGQHKRQFATGSVECVDVLLLRPTAGNLAVAHLLGAFDAIVARGKRVVARLGLGQLARAARR